MKSSFNSNLLNFQCRCRGRFATRQKRLLICATNSWWLHWCRTLSGRNRSPQGCQHVSYCDAMCVCLQIWLPIILHTRVVVSLLFCFHSQIWSRRKENVAFSYIGILLMQDCKVGWCINLTFSRWHRACTCGSAEMSSLSETAEHINLVIAAQLQHYTLSPGYTNLMCFPAGQSKIENLIQNYSWISFNLLNLRWSI